MKQVILCCSALAIFLAGMSLGEEVTVDPMTIPAIKSFLGGGFGERNEKAPAEIEQFGQLVGTWNVEAEMRAQDGSWRKSAPGIWVWKYSIDGFAVSDLWCQSADNLPAYMKNLGRDYLLTANRIYDVAGKKWQVAWMLIF